MWPIEVPNTWLPVIFIANIVINLFALYAYYCL